MENQEGSSLSILLKISRFWPMVFIVVLAFLTADLLVLLSRKALLVKPFRFEGSTKINYSKSDYSYPQIVSRNIFSKDGVIPDSLFMKKSKDSGQMKTDAPDAPPVLSALPINLIGTIVHSDPKKSIANVEVKSKNLAIAIRVGNAIDKLARLETVERGKIIIRNLNNNRLEFLELKEASKLSFSQPKNSDSTEIKAVAPNKFEVKREDVMKYTSDISNVLQQAATLPVRGPGGEILGFRMVNIEPNSIYTQLGFQVGDIIKSVNGEPIDSPAKALELYNALKGESTIRITRERNGQNEDVEYQVK